MKYIRSYKIFESKELNEYIQTLKDIFLEAEDMGYFVSVSPTPLKLARGEDPDIYFNISKNDGNISEIQSIVERAIEYMKENEWKVAYRNITNLIKGYNNYTMTPFSVQITFERI